MKKILFLSVFIGFGICVNAQQCTIQNSNNSQIYVTNQNLKGCTLNVTLESDDPVNPARVTVNVEATYKRGNNTETKPFKGELKVNPNSSGNVNISVDCSIVKNSSNYELVNAKVTDISGLKCVSF
ncbi:MAG: hypothetical protein LBR17_01705 [Bacteroidales bacterium]|jgi:hypothetical protein|nr:hypothetical protein [Bacteroidales bacterium]